MKRRLVALLAGLFAIPCLGSVFLPGLDGAAKRVIERYVETRPPGTATNLSAFGGQFTLNPVAGVGFVCNDNLTVQGTIFGNLSGSASYADTAGTANSYAEADPVALSMGFLNADGVQAQIGLAILSAGQISNPEWWGFLTSESDPVAMSQGFVTGAPWQSEGYLTSLSGRGTSELNNDSGFIAVSGDQFGLGSGFNIYGYAYGTEGRIPDYEQDRVAMSQGFVTPSAVGASDVSSMAYVDGNGVLQCAAFMNPSAYEFDPVAMSAGFIAGGDVPNYETDPVAMSQGFGPALTQVIEWAGNVRIGPDSWFSAMDFACAMDVNEKSIVLSVPGDGGINLHTSHGGDYTCELYVGSRNIGETAFFFNQAIYVGGTKVINKDGTFSEADPVAMSQGFVTASFPGAQDGDLVVVAGGCSSLSSMEPTTWLASHENDPLAMSAGFITSGDVPSYETDPVAMAQGFLTSVPWDASVAYASEAGYAGSANSAYSAEECSSWGGWSHVAIQGNGGQPTVGDMIFMSDAGLAMLSQYNISTPNPPVFLGSEWHDGIGNMPKWLLQSEMQAGYATVSGSTSNVVSGVGQTFSLTNAFAGVTQVVVFADGVVTNRFTLP